MGCFPKMNNIWWCQYLESCCVYLLFILIINFKYSNDKCLSHVKSHKKSLKKLSITFLAKSPYAFPHWHYIKSVYCSTLTASWKLLHDYNRLYAFWKCLLLSNVQLWKYVKGCENQLSVISIDQNRQLVIFLINLIDTTTRLPWF